MTGDPARGANLAHAVRDRLLAEMRAGAFPAGRLPPEAELARDLGVSRATVRGALQTLAEDGIVSRRRRHGTVINEHMLRGNLPLNRLVSFRELIEESGYTASVDQLPRRVEPAPAAVAEALKLAPAERCLVAGRLLHADGVPVIVVVDYLAVQRLLTDPDEVADADTTFSFIARCTSATVDHSRVEIVPSVATEHAPPHLRLAPGTPYAELREVVFSTAHEPIAFSRIAADCRRVRLTLVRRQA